MEAMEGADGASEPPKQKPVTNAGRQYYFVSLKVDVDTGVTSAAERSPFVGLQIGLLLGKGAYGRVYKGYYHGSVVAVKVSSILACLSSLHIQHSARCGTWCLGWARRRSAWRSKLHGNHFAGTDAWAVVPLGEHACMLALHWQLPCQCAYWVALDNRLHAVGAGYPPQ